MLRTLEVSLSPALYPYRTTVGRHITVVNDVLRFTTSLVAAFNYGVKEVIPVATLAEAEDMKLKGYPIAAERDGLRLPFADFGNSAADFNTPAILGKTIAYSTTNGTVAMKLAAENGPVVAAAFTNLPAVAAWLETLDENVVILCSGWKNLISTEDTLCAGALVELLAESGKYSIGCDSALMARAFWKKSKPELRNIIINSSHYHRLLGLGVDPLPDYTLSTGISEALPVFENGRIINKNT
ncbi:MAG: 2-phosphosulfolactate phosphatase [Lentimicrobium sp.]